MGCGRGWLFPDRGGRQPEWGHWSILKSDEYQQVEELLCSSSPLSGLMTLNISKNTDVFFSSLGIGEVGDLENLKGDESRPSCLKTLEKSKNA